MLCAHDQSVNCSPPRCFLMKLSLKLSLRFISPPLTYLSGHGPTHPPHSPPSGPPGPPWPLPHPTHHHSPLKGSDATVSPPTVVPLSLRHPTVVHSARLLKPSSSPFIVMPAPAPVTPLSSRRGSQPPHSRPCCRKLLLALSSSFSSASHKDRAPCQHHGFVKPLPCL